MCITRKSDGGRGDGCKGQKGQWETGLAVPQPSASEAEGQPTCWNTNKSHNHPNQSKEQRLEFVTTFSLNILFAYIITVMYVCLGAVGQDIEVQPFPPPLLGLCYSACHRSFSFSLACLVVTSSLTAVLSFSWGSFSSSKNFQHSKCPARLSDLWLPFLFLFKDLPMPVIPSSIILSLFELDS